MNHRKTDGFKDLSLKREILEIIGIFLFGAIINFIFWCQGCLEDGRTWFINIVVSGSFWVLMWKGSEYMVVYLDTVLPWIEKPLKRFLVSVSMVAAYTTIVVYGLDFLIDVIIMNKSAEQAVQKINYTSLPFAIGMNIGINTFLHGRAFLMEWRQASIDYERLKTKQVFTQFQSLKNQVNPHFLFNSLNALSSLVYENQDKAVEFIRKLAQVYRYVLDRKDEEVVPIADEISFLENFVFLQKIRFGDNLNFNLNIKEESGYLPPLALQLLVENAIKHNVISDDHHLNIGVTIENGNCTVSNNVKEKLGKDSTGIGLTNLKERYQYLSNKEVIFSSNENHFEVKIPILDFISEESLKKEQKI